MPHCPSAKAAAGSRASGGSASAGRHLLVNSGSWTGDSWWFMRPRFVCGRSLPRACSPCAKNLLLIGAVDAKLWRSVFVLRMCFYGDPISGDARKRGRSASEDSLT